MKAQYDSTMDMDYAAYGQVFGIAWVIGCLSWERWYLLGFFLYWHLRSGFTSVSVQTSPAVITIIIILFNHT